MDLEYVDSTNVDQIGYDDLEAEAHVIFKNGGHYVYSQVAAETWEQFRSSPSKGTFVNQEFKAKGYHCRKI
ncbi:KTSC domain-containing protein [Sneathiella sp.]|uniref:KTSC domain-containing protein n=1 Tax=Sneathiella sp. TaxID=1964365 RepID=UPI0035645FD4